MKGRTKVVRAVTDTQATAGRIVVGVDSSQESSAALQWALEQARRTGAVLHAVTAWELPTAFGAPVPLPADFAPAALAHAAAEQEVRAALADASDVTVEITVLEGHPRTVLLEAAKHAQLLVVGRRGRSSWPGLDPRLGQRGLRP